jgi:uncharacterized protein
MKRWFKLLNVLFVVFFVYGVQAQNVPSSKTVEDLEAIFKLTNAEQMIQTMLASMENGMKEGMRASTKGKPLSAAQQAHADAFGREMMNTIRGMIGFDKMKPLMIDAYTQTYTADEIGRIRKLQETEDSKMMLAKQATLMEKTSQSTMKLIGPAVQAMTQRMKL